MKRPGYGSYRGHEYRVRSRGHALTWYAVEVDGELMTSWYPTVREACDEFRAGLVDILGDEGR